MIYKLSSIFVISTLLLIGCQKENINDVSPSNEESNQFQQVKNSLSNKKANLNNEQIAVHLSNVAGSVPGVNNAAAIVAGPYAVVGIDIDKDLDRTRVGTIKFTVSEALRHDLYGKTAVIIADGDILERLRLMGDSIQDGQPIEGIIDELSTIVGRYMPDLPIKEQHFNKPDQNKKIISEEEKKDLNSIEQNQSDEN